MNFSKLVLIALCVVQGLALSLHAQISVRLSTPRHNYLADEPLTAILTISNFAGRDIVLSDTPKDGPWCLFQIKNGRGNFASPRKTERFPPLPIPAGGSVSRSINLTEHFDLSATGNYRITACVTFSLSQDQFWTEPLSVSIDPGSVLWSQTVGVPEGRPHAGTFRSFTLLSHHRSDGNYLYARLEGKQEGIRFSSYSLGRMLAAKRPQPEIDDENNLCVFHALDDASYALSQINVATGQMGQSFYRSSLPNRQGRPNLRRTPEGRLVITNAARITPDELGDENRPSTAKLSDRPPGF